MRKSLALAAISLLALTGCAEPTVAESAPSAPVPVSVASVEPSKVTADASQPTAETVKLRDPAVVYLESVKSAFPEVSIGDKEWIAAGKLACQQREAGRNYSQIDVLDVKGVDTSALGVAAVSILCPELAQQ